MDVVEPVTSMGLKEASEEYISNLKFPAADAVNWGELNESGVAEAGGYKLEVIVEPSGSSNLTAILANDPTINPPISNFKRSYIVFVFAGINKLAVIGADVKASNPSAVVDAVMNNSSDSFKVFASM